MFTRINAGLAVVMTGVVILALFVHRERLESLPTPTGEKAPAGLARYYEQDVTWSKCRGARCTTVTVPLDYAHPGGRTIGLKVTLHPATHPPTRDLLFVNPGGPGGSAVEYAGGFAHDASSGITSKLGIVGVDPRGVGTSRPVECLTKPQLDTFLDVDPSPDDKEEVDDLKSAVERLGATCIKNSGAGLVSHMSTEEAVRDLDIVRAVLGQEKLRYYGASYGTQIGATYAHLFPQRTGLMVLDGGIDPRLSAASQAFDQAKGFEKALRRFLAYCAKRDDCPVGDDRKRAEQRVVDIIGEADREPLDSGGGVRPATEAAAIRGIAFALYDRERWPALLVALTRATFGDGVALRQLSDKYDQRDERGYDNNSTVAYRAVHCLDFPDAMNFKAVPTVLARFVKAAPVFGPSMAWSAAECSAWPTDSAHRQAKDVSAPGVHSIVVVGTTHDPATPFAWSKALVRNLGSARLVTREGDGHTGYQMGNRCVDRIVERHLLGRDTVTGHATCDERGRLTP